MNSNNVLNETGAVSLGNSTSVRARVYSTGISMPLSPPSFLFVEGSQHQYNNLQSPYPHSFSASTPLTDTPLSPFADSIASLSEAGTPYVHYSEPEDDYDDPLDSVPTDVEETWNDLHRTINAPLSVPNSIINNIPPRTETKAASVLPKIEVRSEWAETTRVQKRGVISSCADDSVQHNEPSQNSTCVSSVRLDLPAAEKRKLDEIDETTLSIALNSIGGAKSGDGFVSDHEVAVAGMQSIYQQLQHVLGNLRHGDTASLYDFILEVQAPLARLLESQEKLRNNERQKLRNNESPSFANQTHSSVVLTTGSNSPIQVDGYDIPRNVWAAAFVLDDYVKAAVVLFEYLFSQHEKLTCTLSGRKSQKSRSALDKRRMLAIYKAVQWMRDRKKDPYSFNNPGQSYSLLTENEQKRVKNAFSQRLNVIKQRTKIQPDQNHWQEDIIPTQDVFLNQNSQF